ncbi:putative nucleic acid-binding protein [Methylobacterium brachiatum]|uniref:Ribonuclease VapC n=2 Tax=Methylobacterium TaxID=407 RepID=A0A509EH39_9HYPH|nr:MULTISPECIES: type II toxin-antitoxin system VapC family toxin [Methylobacterium]MBY0252257.1 type II toxin-antitoxin system VapC family toxin [Methylobacterium organophilum]MCB4806356.1 type II toxin-antitoxin system VapC family toxin [Methylobacterium brachiatum]MDQ0547278.1 putative nucleic acid-binding protein [Methylobacterium brachiatum]VUD73372.1 tRNA(fMet)-specific endonuclease VapC [Methylobacterium symbioticum]
MSHCVLDCSAALSWVLPGESDAATDALLDTVAAAGAVAPALWPFEVANVLLMAERRGRIMPAERQQALVLLGELQIHIDGQAVARAWTDTLALAQVHRLTVYDASYLELAVRLGLPLASRDMELRSAASACGVSLSI